jgi:hypothetical protein
MRGADRRPLRVALADGRLLVFARMVGGGGWPADARSGSERPGARPSTAERWWSPSPPTPDTSIPRSPPAVPRTPPPSCSTTAWWPAMPAGRRSRAGRAHPSYFKRGLPCRDALVMRVILDASVQVLALEIDLLDPGRRSRADSAARSAAGGLSAGRREPAATIRTRRQRSPREPPSGQGSARRAWHEASSSHCSTLSYTDDDDGSQAHQPSQPAWTTS